MSGREKVTRIRLKRYNFGIFWLSGVHNSAPLSKNDTDWFFNIFTHFGIANERFMKPVLISESIDLPEHRSTAFTMPVTSGIWDSKTICPKKGGLLSLTDHYLKVHTEI